MKKSIHLATVRTAGRVYHIVPNGNRHAQCGVIATNEVDGPTVGRNCVAGTHHVCKNCMRTKPARNLNPVPVGDPTDTWTVSDKAGNQLCRITGRDIHIAARRACQVPSVDAVSRREGGLSLRRLRTSEL